MPRKKAARNNEDVEGNGESSTPTTRRQASRTQTPSSSVQPRASASKKRQRADTHHSPASGAAASRASASRNGAAAGTSTASGAAAAASTGTEPSAARSNGNVAFHDSYGGSLHSNDYLRNRFNGYWDAMTSAQMPPIEDTDMDTSMGHQPTPTPVASASRPDLPANNAGSLLVVTASYYGPRSDNVSHHGPSAYPTPLRHSSLLMHNDAQLARDCYYPEFGDMETEPSSIMSSISNNAAASTNPHQERLVSQLMEMGFPDRNEIVRGINCQHIPVHQVTADQVMMWIVNQREEAEEAKKMDMTRMESEKFRVEHEQAMKRNFQDRLDTATTIPALLEIFPDSWLLADGHGETFQPILASDARPNFAELISLENKCKKWYGTLPSSYFSELRGMLGKVPEDSWGIWLSTKCEALQCSLYRLDQQQGGVPKVFLEAMEAAMAEAADDDDDVILVGHYPPPSSTSDNLPAPSQDVKPPGGVVVNAGPCAETTTTNMDSEETVDLE
eukprot:Nitzschia sp. Nitz4//scaffold110_size71422//54641//56149//NITZ4_005881-RA/size71422-processed-gene-0.74-mRNA-1//-1//CDS//3329533110//3379//frame0